MTSRLRWLTITAFALLIGYSAMLAFWSEARSSLRVLALRDKKPVASGVQFKQSHKNYQQVKVTIEIPSREEVWPTDQKISNCPSHKISSILGVTLSSPNGVILSKVHPGGPAEKSGLQPGDALCDFSQCASSFISRVAPGSEKRTVELIIYRPQLTQGEKEEAEAETSPPKQESETADQQDKQESDKSP